MTMYAEDKENPDLNLKIPSLARDRSVSHTFGIGQKFRKAIPVIKEKHPEEDIIKETKVKTVSQGPKSMIQNDNGKVLKGNIL